MPVVKMPNGDLVNFPDDMPKEKISAFIATRFPNEVKAHLDDAASAVKSGMSWSQVAGNFATKSAKYLDDAVRSVASGATFGYADELAAKMGSLTGVGGKKGDYESNLAAQRARDAEISPAISIPGEIAGGVASTVAAAPATAAAGAVTGLSKLPAAAKAIGSAAGVGALFGSGESEGGLQNRLEGAAKGGAIGAATGGVLSLAGKIFGAAGDKIMTSVIRPTARDVADGFSLDTIKKFDLGGSLNTTYEKTQSKLGELSTQLREKLAASKETINLGEIVDQTRKELNSSGKLKGFGANQKISAALDSLGEEVNLVGDKLSIPDAQIVKQASGSFGAWQFGRPDPESKASEVVFNAFYNKLKTAIEKASPEGVKEINQDISRLIPVNNALIRRMPVASRNHMVSLTDMVSFAASMIDPRAAGMSVLSLMQKSGAVGNALSKAGSKIPKASLPLTIGGASALQQQPQ